ncbi:lipopolysaccharide assembly protein LapA domain-containing protein [Pedobacter sp. R20-19]|uniref:lipopolysaccharide assembly protein LapA domain-containing protein n=1 Tax=Pedobacter sp. R20-19 TaxID=1270196 RepID=UPI0004939E17|nr:lipopolysaccharide assembly protein LapA domain-containing protein [Pedobacter sp. R20-19]
MSGKTIFIIILTALLTAFLFLNSDEVAFNFIVVDGVFVSKLLVIGICVIIGFIIGFIVGRPKKTISSYDNEIERNQQTANKKELSDEDREYIS